MSTSRTEIAEHVAPAFDDGAATKDDLLATAHTTGAPPAVLDELQRLPEQSFRGLRELWPELPGLPVEA